MGRGDRFCVVRDYGDGHGEMLIDGILYVGRLLKEDDLRTQISEWKVQKKHEITSRLIAEATNIAGCARRHFGDAFIALYLAAWDANPGVRPNTQDILKDAAADMLRKMEGV